MARWSVAMAAPVASARGASHSRSRGRRRAGLLQMAAWSFRMSRGAPRRVTLSWVGAWGWGASGSEARSGESCRGGVCAPAHIPAASGRRQNRQAHGMWRRRSRACGKEQPLASEDGRAGTFFIIAQHLPGCFRKIDFHVVQIVLGVFPDEGAVFFVQFAAEPARWMEGPYWRHFSGERYFQHPAPVGGPETCFSSEGARTPSLIS